jgi:hypothetical protein
MGRVLGPNTSTSLQATLAAEGQFLLQQQIYELSKVSDCQAGIPRQKGRIWNQKKT